VPPPQSLQVIAPDASVNLPELQLLHSVEPKALE
jgi:hypothetical protein